MPLCLCSERSRFYLFMHFRHHHRHGNRHVSRNGNSSGGHSITVTTNRSHGGCSNLASTRAISHPQLTPKTSSSATASVSVSVAPRRSGGDRIPNCSISSNSANRTISEATSHNCESVTHHNGHRKRAIRDARFTNNGQEVDPERAPKRTPRNPITVKQEVALQENDNQMEPNNSGSSNATRERKEKKREHLASTSCTTALKKEHVMDENCAVTSSTVDVEERIEIINRDSNINDARNGNRALQPPDLRTSPGRSLSSHLPSSYKGEPSKLSNSENTKFDTSSRLKQEHDTNVEDTTDHVEWKDMKMEDKESVNNSELQSRIFDENGDAPRMGNSPESPQPGPSGLQPSSSTDNQVNGTATFTVLQNAPDLQLDCLSSDTEDEVNEDVTVVKISRRRKGTNRKRWNANGRAHSEINSSTTTINAPPGTVVEVDLTQESDTDENEIHVDAIHPPPPLSGPHPSGLYSNHYSMDCASTDTNDDSPNNVGGGIKLRRFATAPHGALPPNVQSAGSSRGSTPSSTPGPSSLATAPQGISSNPNGAAVPTEGSSNLRSISNDDRYCNIERLRMCNYSASRPLPPPEMNQGSYRMHRSYGLNHCNGECTSLPAYEPAPAHAPSIPATHGTRHNISSTPPPSAVSQRSRNGHSRHLPHSRSSHHLDDTHSSRISNPSFDQWTFRPRRLRAPEGSIAPSASTVRSGSTMDGNIHPHSQQSVHHHANLHHQQPHVPNDCPDAHCQLHQNSGSVIMLGSPPREYHRAPSSQANNGQLPSVRPPADRAHQSNNPVQQQTQPVDFRRSSSASRSSTDTTRGSTETVAPTTISTNNSRNETTNPARNNEALPQHIPNTQPPPPPYPSDASDLLRPYHQVALAPTASAFDSVANGHVPRQDQRLLNAVWRMQYHPLRSTRHPRHQRLWTSHQMQQEQMRRHMGSAAAAASNAPSANNDTTANQSQPSIELGMLYICPLQFRRRVKIILNA